MCLTEKRNQPLPFQQKAQLRRLVYSAWITLVVASMLWADDSQIPRSNLEGKKLIRISQSLLGHVEPENVATKLDEWQETGYDGLCFCWRADLKEGEQRKPMNWGWWDVDLRQRSEFDADVRTYRSIANWGKFTDNFMLMASHAEGHKPPDWFNDDDWKIVLANTKLCARITREIGFKGIVFDIEGYGGGRMASGGSRGITRSMREATTRLRSVTSRESFKPWPPKSASAGGNGLRRYPASFPISC